MFLPRYSLRWLLGLTTVSAGISLVLSYAVRGRPWALGFIAGLWSFVLLAVFYAVAFLAAWLIARGLRLRASRQDRSGLSEYPPPAKAVDTPPSITG